MPSFVSKRRDNARYERLRCLGGGVQASQIDRDNSSKSATARYSLKDAALTASWRQPIFQKYRDFSRCHRCHFLNKKRVDRRESSGKLWVGSRDD